jgi:hypothetical protein
MKLIDIKPLDRGNTTWADAEQPATNEQVASMGEMGKEPGTPPDAELGAEAEIDAAVSRVFAAETIQDKIDRVAIANAGHR